jgi:hypothetical protein
MSGLSSYFFRQVPGQLHYFSTTAMGLLLFRDIHGRNLLLSCNTPPNRQFPLIIYERNPAGVSGIFPLTEPNC